MASLLVILISLILLSFAVRDTIVVAILISTIDIFKHAFYIVRHF